MGISNIQDYFLDNKKNKTEYGEFESISANIFNTLTNAILVDQSSMNKAFEKLPVIARNKLENGLSENLWYEEFVPRESIFYFMIAVPEADTYYNEFKAKIDNKVIQIGANATVGYGYSKINCLN